MIFNGKDKFRFSIYEPFSLGFDFPMKSAIFWAAAQVGITVFLHSTRFSVHDETVRIVLGSSPKWEQVATPIYVNRLELIINKLLIKTNESFWLLFKLLFKLLFELLFKLLFELLLKL